MNRTSVYTALFPLLVTTPAFASPLFELAGGLGTDGGFNARTTGQTAAATYFNPALLARAERRFDLGAFMVSDQIEMILDGRPSGDVPLVVGDRNAYHPDTGAPISNDTLPTDWLERGCPESQCPEGGRSATPRQAAGSGGNTRGYASLGLVAPIFQDILAFGFQAIIPVGDFTTTHAFYNDEREQYFSNSLHSELYSDRLTAMSLAFGVGGALTDSIAIGVGTTVNLINSAKAETYVRDPADYHKLRMSQSVSVNSSIAPHFGVQILASDSLSLTGTVHTEQKFVVETEFGATLPDGDQSSTRRISVHNYVPLSAAVGARYVFNPESKSRLSVASTLVLENWSDYVDRHGETPSVYGEQFAWSNTLNPSLGIHYAGETTRVGVDGTYHPTPVPAQIGRSNYVDNDRIAVNFSVSRSFSIGDGAEIRPGLGVQVHRLIPRYQRKDPTLLRDEFPDGSVDEDLEAIEASQGLQTNNPGFPGFQSQGWILAGGLSLALIY